MRAMTMGQRALAAAAGLLLIALVVMAGCSAAGGPGATNFDRVGIEAPTEMATQYPALEVNNHGLGAAIEVQDAGTPVFVVDSDGNTTISGTCSGCSVNSASGLRIAQPTTAATATPALAVSSLSSGAKLLEVADAATPVFSILNGGAVSRTGDDTMTGDLNVTGAGKVAAATTVATATPALVVDSLGESNLLEVRDAATPVFAINDGGAVVGNVLQYGSSGEKAVASTISMTGTYTVAHGLTTVTWAMCTLGRDPDDDAGDAAHMTVEVSGNVVLAKMWQDDFVSAATEADVTAHCLVIGTP